MKIKKKILILSVHLERRGGVSNYVTLLIKNLNKDEFQIRHCATGKSVVGWKNILFPILFIYQLFRIWFLIKEFKPDVLHINPSLNSTAIIRDTVFLFMAKKAKVPVLFFVRGWKKKISKYFNGNEIISNIFKWIFSMPERIVVLAKEFKKELIDLGIDPQKVEISKTMVETEKYEIDKKRFGYPIKLLFCSRIEKYKGIYELLEAIPLVIKQFPETKLIFMGNGSELVNLRKRICNDHLSNIVNCIGYKDGDEKIKIFLENNIFILPSYSEGFPNVYCEALAAGMPIVTSPVGGLKDVFKDGKQGFLIQSHPPDPYEIAEKILKLIRDQKLMKNMSKNNFKEAVEKYDVKVVSQEVEEIYNQIVPRKIR